MPKSNMTLIKNINVITMTDERVLVKQDVLIEDRFIKKIVPRGQLKIVVDSEIDGTGKYLMPGLFDMHAHVNEERFLKLFLLNGITAVRDLGNVDESIFKLKDDISSGKILGPRLFVSGKILEGDPPFWQGFNVIKSKAQAIGAVKELKAKGADQVKVYHTLSPELHKAIIDTAHNLGMKVTGHVPQAMTVLKALAAGQDGIEHLTSITDYIGQIDYEDANEPGYKGWRRFTDYRIKDKELKKLTKAFKSSNAYFCPTLIVDRQFSSLADYKSLVKETDATYIESHYINEEWNPQSKNASTNIRGVKPLWFKNYSVIYNGSKSAIRTIKGGAIMLAGTDTPNPFVVPGFSLAKELELLVESGLSCFEALQAATVNAAKWLGVNDKLGAVSEGKVANIIVLGKNPLERIENIKNIETVILNGTAHSRTKLERQAKLSEYQ